MSGESPKSDESALPPSAEPVDHPRVVESAPREGSGHSHAHLPQIQRLLHRIKQRNVGRIAILYIVVCYVILEPFEMFFHLLELPAWTGRTVVFLMVLGFPAALLLAWIYEITPTGIKPSTEVDPRQSIARQTGRKLDRAIIAVLAVALVYFVADKFCLSKRVAVVAPEAAVSSLKSIVAAAPAAAEKSVAVLPFVDMSEKKDQEYFSDGLSEELIDMLTKIPDLRVPARTSSFYFKGKQATIADIAKLLGVSHLLEGSVRKSGKTIRITAQLIRADNGYHVWSKTYDRQLDDIFKVQDEIAGAVVSALQISLSANAARGAPKSSSADSYALLMQAQYFLFRQTLEDQRKALEYYKRAIEADHASAVAWGGLSRATANLWTLGALSWKDAYADALRAAERAVALDPQLADAHIALGKVYLVLGQDFGSAKREFDVARALDPESAVTLFWSALTAMSAGDLKNAIQLSQQAAAKDPLDGETNIILGQAYYYVGRPKEATIAYRKALDLIPARPGLRSDLGLALLAQGERDEGLQEIAGEADVSQRDTALAGAYYILGRLAEARSALMQLEAARAESDAYSIAINYALRGDRDQAFLWLDRASRQHEDLMDLKINPWFGSLRGDPRYQTLLRELNLPQ
jgi:adenylate cyclase